MNILLISHDFTVTGAPNSLLRQAVYFKEAGHTVDVWSLGDGGLKDRYIEKGFNPKIIQDTPSAILEEYNTRTKEYDFILCNTTVTYKCVDVLQHQGIPLVWFIRETMLVDKGMKEDPYFAKVFSNFHNLYTVSDYAATIIKKYNPHVRIINNAVADSFKGYTRLTEKIRFGFIGSILKQKGIDLLISAFMKLYKENQQIELHIAGHKVSDYIEMTQNCPAIIWHGEVQGTEKEDFFNSIDILCVPSIDEPSGLTLIEGTMKGKVIITTDTVGANYLVSENGFIVKSADENELYQAMKKCLTSPLKKMQNKSRKMYLKLGSSKVERKNVLKMLADNAPQPFKIFKKVKKPNGRRHIYFCGIKVFSYKRHHTMPTVLSDSEFNILYANRFSPSLSLNDKKEILKYQFFQQLGYIPNIDKPKTFNEKLQWLKLYYFDSLMTTCADKVSVREFIKEKIGEEYLVPCLGVWDNPDEIDFDKLPNQFVLKVNWGSGQNIIVKDKSALDINATKKQLAEWMKPESNLYFYSFEPGYKNIKPKIIAEKFLSKEISPYEIQIYIFNKKIRFFSIETIKSAIPLRRKLYYPSFKATEFTLSSQVYQNLVDICPKKYVQQAFFLAKKLKLPFPFLRLDFCICNEIIKFREITFISGAGFSIVAPKKYSLKLGKWLKLPKKKPAK